MIDLVFQNFTIDKQFGESFFRKILGGAIEVLSSDLQPTTYKLQPVSISINLIGAGKIKGLNKKYRNKNKVTDILSFPMQSEELFDCAQGPASNAEAFDAGDIFICLPFAKKQAKRENISIEKKLAQLTVHGFLHLMGYDHERSEEDAEEMFSLENQILNKITNL